MKSYLQILTTPTSDTPGTALFLDVGGKRYVFGRMAEGTQRACVEEGTKVLRISEVFITGRLQWTNVGGLFGFILTLADSLTNSAASAAETLKEKLAKKGTTMGREKIERLQADYKAKLNDRPTLRLFGPSNLNYLLATARRFIFRTSMPLTIHEVPEIRASQAQELGPDPAAFMFQDGHIKVWAMSSARELPVQHSPRSTQAARKRSHDEIDGDAPDSVAADPRTRPAADGAHAAASQLVKQVVTAMFSSDWKADRLNECSLGEVKLPATIFVRDADTKQVKQFAGPMPGQEGYQPDTKVLVRSPWPAVAMTSRLPPPQLTAEAVSYIVHTYPQRGKFDPAKAVALGLTDKSKYSRLTQGLTVVTDAGKEIHPDMVIGPTKPATGFLVIDLPTTYYVNSFLRNYAALPDEKRRGVTAFIWIVGKGVRPLLRDFVSAHPQATHFFSDRQLAADRLSFDSAAAVTKRLSAIDPQRYFVPDHKPEDALQSLEDSPNVFVMDRGQTFQLEPTPQMINGDAPERFDPDAALALVPDNALEAAKAAQINVVQDRAALDKWASRITDPGTEVITLGTGSAAPSKHRNVSATLVRIPNWGSILFDCGEGTLGQLQRMFKPPEFDKIMSELRIIWISHLHADHHLGTTSVIAAWNSSVNRAEYAHGQAVQSSSTAGTPVFDHSSSRGTPSLAVLSDEAMLHWLWEYGQVEGNGLDKIVPVCIRPTYPIAAMNTSLRRFEPPAEHSDTNASGSDAPYRNLGLQELGLKDMQAVRVAHCNGAMAVTFTLPSGFKVSYSGDCRPALYTFTRIGRNSDLLIHEATFDDELAGDAVAKRHSTTGEALEVAAKMGAKAVVLTHFSQRYAKVPVISSDKAGTESGAAAEEAELALAEQEAREAALAAENDMNDDAVAAPASPDRTAKSKHRRSSSSSSSASSRSSSLKAVTRVRGGQDMKVCMAFDYMRVKVGEIAHMEKYVPALVALLESEEVQNGALKGQKGQGKYAKGEGRKGATEKRSIGDKKGGKKNGKGAKKQEKPVDRAGSGRNGAQAKSSNGADVDMAEAPTA